MKEIDYKDFCGIVEPSKKLCIIDLYADWCGPCKTMEPVLDEIEKENPDVLFFRVNVDKEPELVKMFKVKDIPMIAAVKDDTFLDFSVGVVEKSVIQELINENI